MAYDETLRAAATQAGVQQEFWDIFGRRHITTPEANRAILEALGFDCSSAESIAASAARRSKEEGSRMLPWVVVATEGSPISIRLTTPDTLPSLALEVLSEGGAAQRFNFKFDALPPVPHSRSRWDAPRGAGGGIAGAARGGLLHGDGWE